MSITLVDWMIANVSGTDLCSKSKGASPESAMSLVSRYRFAEFFNEPVEIQAFFHNASAKDMYE